MKNQLSLVLLFATTLIPACAADSSTTTPGADPLAGENGQDGDASKADSPHDDFTYLAVEKQGDCNGPVNCTPYKLTRVNRSTTVCNDGKAHASCSVADVTYSGFSEGAQTTIEAAIQQQAEVPSIGTQVIVKGEFKTFTDLVSFNATEVWVAQLQGGQIDGTWVRVSDNGRKCITTPCADLLEERLNSNRSANIDDLDWSTAADEAVQQVESDTDAQLAKADGAIIVGNRSTSSHPTNTLRTVEQVFLPVK